MREKLGNKKEVIAIQKGETIPDLWNRYKLKIPGWKNLSVLFAVNGEYAEEKRELKDGDEVAFIPPVSGG